MRNELTIYLNRDNEDALVFLSDYVAINHASITRCQIVIGSQLIDSAVNPAFFGFASDKLTVKLGAATLTVGQFDAQFILFDTAHPNGIVWSHFKISVKSV